MTDGCRDRTSTVEVQAGFEGFSGVGCDVRDRNDRSGSNGRGMLYEHKCDLLL